MKTTTYRIEPVAASKSFKVAGLFAGIGGIELGLHRAGHETVLFCENDTSAQAVLRAQFPGIPLHDNVVTLKALPEIDLVTAGFPCQDLSQAGKTVGIEGARSGLVGEVFRLLKRRRVEWVLLENVPFMLQLSRGRAMGVIVAALEALDYKWAYRVVDTNAFGLPQRRRRVMLVASQNHDPRTVLYADDAGARTPRGSFPDIACGFYWTEGTRGLGWAVDAIPTLKGGSTVGIPSPPGIIYPDGSIMQPAIRDAERFQGFPVDWTEPAVRAGRHTLRWKLVGNAVSTNVAEWLGRRFANPGAPLDVPFAVIPEGKPWPTAAFNVGAGRYAVQLSEWPELQESEPLSQFLKYTPRPLSHRASAGFLSRAKSGSLRFPAGFLAKVEHHMRKMEKHSETVIPVSLVESAA